MYFLDKKKKANTEKCGNDGVWDMFPGWLEMEFVARKRGAQKEGRARGGNVLKGVHRKGTDFKSKKRKTLFVRFVVSVKVAKRILWLDVDWVIKKRETGPVFERKGMATGSEP